MSHNVHTEIKKNVAHLYSNDVITEAAELREENYPDDPHGPSPDFEVAGWKGGENMSDKDDLIGYVLTKGIHAIHLINSAEGSHVGEYEWTVFGTKPSVTAFLKDVGSQAKIEKQAVVQSWW
jgi:hypothetical protein